MMNEWTASGRIFYVREFGAEFPEFGASVKIRGASGTDARMSILELACLVPRKLYEAEKERVRPNSNVTVSGHMETWQKQGRNRVDTKTMFIVDYILGL